MSVIALLGIPDPWVWLAYVLCLASTVLCVVWGCARWNQEDKAAEPQDEVKHWSEEEDKVEEQL